MLGKKYKTAPTKNKSPPLEEKQPPKNYTSAMLFLK
jgi:hypothetical protein